MSGRPASAASKARIGARPLIGYQAANTPVRKRARPVAQRACQGGELVGLLVGRVEQDEAATLRRRQEGGQGRVAVSPVHGHLAVGGEQPAECGVLGLVQLGGDEAVAGPEPGADERR